MKRSDTDIFLRPTQEAEIDAVLGMEQNPVNTSFIRQWSRDQHLSALADDHYGHFIVEEDQGEMMGYVILTGLDDPDKSIEFKRIVIHEKGRGLGRKAVLLVKAKVFEEFNAHRLWLEVMPTNQRAHALYESMGFVKEGIHREALKMGKTYLSLIVMSILSHEYFNLLKKQTS